MNTPTPKKMKKEKDVEQVFKWVNQKKIRPFTAYLLLGSILNADRVLFSSPPEEEITS